MREGQIDEQELLLRALTIECILDDIRQRYAGLGDPLKWTDATIRSFLEDMHAHIKQRILNEPELFLYQRQILKTKDEPLNIDSFKNHFIRRKNYPGTNTRNRYALLLGYRSADEYTRLRVFPELHEMRPAEKAVTDIETPKTTTQEIPELFPTVKHGLAVNILLFPFQHLGGHAVDMAALLREELYWLIGEDEFAHSLVNVAVWPDDTSVGKTEAEYLELGKEQGANVIFWGSYLSNADKTRSINLYYSLIGTQYQHLLERKNRVRLKDESLNLGSLDEDGFVQRVLNTCLAVASLQLNNSIRFIDYKQRVESELVINEAVYWRSKGRLHYDLKEFEQAVTHYEKALGIEPDHYKTMLNMGSALRELEKKTDAVGYYKKAIALNPEYDKAYVNLGNTYYALGSYEQCLQFYDKAKQLNPNDPYIYFNAAEVLFKQCQFEDSFKQLQEYYRLANSAADTKTALDEILEVLSQPVAQLTDTERSRLVKQITTFLQGLPE